MEDFGYRNPPCEVCGVDPYDCECPECSSCGLQGVTLTDGLCGDCYEKTDPEREVEIHPAHLWTCEDCGRDNFERGVSADFLTPEEYREVCAEMGIFDPMIDAEPPEGAIMSAPEEVVCRFCDARFKTVDVREDK